MKKALSTCLCLLLLFGVATVQAQTFKVSGKIVANSNQQGLDYATATLLRLPDSATVGVQYSNAQGIYEFKEVKPGNYLIMAYYLGYEKAKSDVFSIASADLELSTLRLISNARTLKEVTVKGNKPLIERKIDRMVFNLENSIAAKGTDLTQALALTPMLRVEESGISIVGKGGVAVMINERMVQLRGSDLMNYLKSLRSDDIEKIEVITTPPAKYEAQGNSGLINIVVKSNPNLGWSGNFSPSFMQSTYSSFANNLNVNYQTPKLASSVKLRQYHRLSHIDEQTDNIGVNSILSSDPRKSISNGIGANLSLDYKAGKRASLGLIYDVGKTSSDMNIDNATVYQTHGVTDSVLRTVSHNENPNLNQTLSLYYDQKLDSLGKKLSTSFNFFGAQPETTNNFQTTSDQTGQTNRVRNFNGIKYNVWSAQADLVWPYQWALVETGLKFANFDQDAETAYSNFVQDAFRPDPLRSNLFEYNEKNMAGYISLQKELHKKWEAKAGLRYEYTLIDGYSPTINSRSKSEYGKLFPTVYLSYKPNTKSTFSINYSKRINRPNLRAINPAKWYSNANTYFTGNPFLKPSYNHNVELSYLRGNLSFTAYGQKLVNGYGYIVEVKDALKVVNAYNYLTQYSAGLTVSLNQKFFPWWENSSFASYSYSSAESVLPQVLAQKGSAFYYSINNTFKTSRQTSAFVNFRQSLSSRQNNMYNQGRYVLSAGARVTFADNKFQVNASVNDILKGDLERNRMYYADGIQYSSTYYDTRMFNLNFTYTFGKSRVKGSQKQINFKETQRAN
ncbi:TonB-dependent receptor [Pedobacter sp. KR3-3]|uniref:TonB-dependent receptor n=1 Tax=Pedobacter albus TaxID=3113905 RepID=A0ABU7IA69_9SPHI|nr:TonB-dependent receptor [Pedobacter sp. KR3-3]MEE1946383.1 TonB-dependent receptor [Pedobacter sp. KR3-3]